MTPDPPVPEMVALELVEPLLLDVLPPEPAGAPSTTTFPPQPQARRSTPPNAFTDRPVPMAGHRITPARRHEPGRTLGGQCYRPMRPTAVPLGSVK